MAAFTETVLQDAIGYAFGLIVLWHPVI